MKVPHRGNVTQYLLQIPPLQKRHAGIFHLKDQIGNTPFYSLFNFPFLLVILTPISSKLLA